MNGLLKNTFRQIYRTKGRFLAIVAIIAIGSGFFAGVKVTSPDMKDTADKYYNDCGLMSFRFKSEGGFTEDDVTRISELDGVSKIYAGYTADVYMEMNDAANEIVRVYSYDFDKTDFNKPVLLDGRLPAAPNECLIEANTPYKVGDKIKLSLETADEIISDYLTETEFTAVGSVMWPMYVDFERGSTSLGNGVVQSYLIVPEKSFAYDVYTDVYITAAELDGVYSFSDEYAAIQTDKKKFFDVKCADLALIQGQRLYDENVGVVDEARKEYTESKTAYDDAVKASDSEFEAEWSKLERAKSDVEKQRAAIFKQRDEYDEKLAAYSSGILDANEQKKTLDAEALQLEAKENENKDALKTLDSLSEALEVYHRKKIAMPYVGDLAELYKDVSKLDSDEYSFSQSLEQYLAASPGAQKNVYKYSILGYISEISPHYEDELAAARSGLKRVNLDLVENERQMNILADSKTQLDKTLTAIDKDMELVNKAQSEYDDGVKKCNAEKADADLKFADAAAELDKALADVEDAEVELQSFASGLKWFVFTRDDNVGYSNYEADADRVNSIAKVFPIFFIIVAALVCLTTMTRMVEEQRTEIGTIKALGYSRGSVLVQYLLYSALASLIGVVLGLAVCMKLFPTVIFSTYKLMYNYPEVICPYKWQYVLGSLIAAFLCTGLSSLAACYKELISVPAQLMRPRPPKDGKRVLLEKVPFIWKRMGFLQKVAARNVFRFKNRVVMTVIGIGGCTALLLTGFALRYSISAIIDLQYDEIFSYDFMTIYDNAAPTEEKDALRVAVGESGYISESMHAYQKTISVSSEKRSVDVYLFAPETMSKLSEFINLRDRKSGEALKLSEGVIINEKLAKLLGVREGDSISLDGAPYNVRVSGITENYAYNYVYMTSTVYAELFGVYSPNLVIGNMTDTSAEDALSEKLLEHSPVQLISYTAVAGKKFSDLIGKLNYVVFLIILSSAALAFVVLYNLCNISITERMRELATIKVLGFYDGEVSAYVYRENVVSAVLGLAAGLLGGIFLAHFVVTTAEIDMVMFAPDIPWHCFVAAGLLTLLFVFAINALMFFKLRKIDMASSMKAIE